MSSIMNWQWSIHHYQGCLIFQQDCELQFKFKPLCYYFLQVIQGKDHEEDNLTDHQDWASSFSSLWRSLVLERVSCLSTSWQGKLNCNYLWEHFLISCVVHIHVQLDVPPPEVVKVKISGDGAQFSKTYKFILLSFSLPFFSSNVLSSSGRFITLYQ